MSNTNAQPEKPIPAWIFVGALVICVGALGLFRLTREVKRRAEPVISEIQTLNQTGLRDGEFERADWIEIWNPTDQPIQLEGYFLTDSFRNLQRWRFPRRTLDPKGFLIVFASGKNITRDFGELHTDFRLGPEGEYLALVAPNGTRVVQEFLPKYPKQFGDISFGLKPEIFEEGKPRLSGMMQDMSFLLRPTPGAPNEMEMLGLVADTKFSVNRGFLFSPTNVSLSVATRNADIRYTVDGSAPNETNGALYANPIKIDHTTVLRVAAFRPGFKPSNVDSHTFIFPEQMAGELASTASDLSIDQIVKGLVDLPAFSLIIPNAGIWQTMGNDRDKRASLEIIDPIEGGNRQVDCGVRLSGLSSTGIGTVARKSFELKFDLEFGDPELKHPLFGRRKPRTFHGLLLWGGSSAPGSDRLESQLSDAWVRSTVLELGMPAPRSRFVNLFMNGSFRGVYSVVELPETPYLATEPGTELPKFDVRIGNVQRLGDPIEWDKLMAMASLQSPADVEMYEVLEARLSMDAFIDFMLVQLFAGTTDLDRDGEWMAVRPRAGTTGFEFVTTVNSKTMTDWSANALSFDDMQSPSRLFQVLRRDAGFRRRFAARAKEVLGAGGVLSVEESGKRLQTLRAEISVAAIADEQHWEAGDPVSLVEFLKKRPGEFKKQLESAGLWK